ncbi:replicative DNA helicase [Melioribacter roseus P3M-2]|uniref:Replicative DNA helicase n=1 Tax=Melioribacter roseus (strain DSM 23840 / JCM 17771 / VKM B-2668 / P3M-2) TaxID=1191523 RepID=I6YWK1_MELRP|nr:replicative DNA helicase [Melioribacter roseus]AFN74932.1 replicative DNA helicase [Melioribacter roseus P3M-2]
MARTRKDNTRLEDSGKFSRDGALRQPPAAVEVERAVLGAMLLDNNAVPKAVEVLKPDAFYDPRNKTIFEVMLSLYESDEPIDLVTLYEELKKSGKFERAGGAAYISQLTEDTTSAANIDYHSRIVLEKWILRQLISTSSEIAEMAFEGKEDVFDLLDEAESKIFRISEEGIKESFTSMDRAVKESLELIEAIHSKKTSFNAVPSGYYELDTMLGGFQKSDLVIIAARPSMGKTAFAMSIARNAAVDHQVPIAVFSLEMSTIQLATRLISAEAKINAHSLRTGKFKAEDYARISRTVHKLSKAPIYIDDTPGITVLELRAKARRLKNEKNIGMIVVDYLQLVNPSTMLESREREISTISRSLKALAKELNVPVIALSQLNRAVEQRSDKKPMLSDLRESGSIEQDADVVIFLYRPEVYGITTYTNGEAGGESTDGIAEVIIGKQRNGPIGEIKLKFVKEYARFENLEKFRQALPEGDVEAMDDQEPF